MAKGFIVISVVKMDTTSEGGAHRSSCLKLDTISEDGAHRILAVTFERLTMNRSYIAPVLRSH